MTVLHWEKKWEILNFAGFMSTGQSLCRFAFYEAVYESCEMLSERHWNSHIFLNEISAKFLIWKSTFDQPNSYSMFIQNEYFPKKKKTNFVWRPFFLPKNYVSIFIFVLKVLPKQKINCWFY